MGEQSEWKLVRRSPLLDFRFHAAVGAMWKQRVPDVMATGTLVEESRAACRASVAFLLSGGIP